MKTHSSVPKNLHGGMHALHIVFSANSERRASAHRSPGPGEQYLKPTHQTACLS